MIKKGFTLAEILLTLGIIGVVAAMTLPLLFNNVNDRANAAKLSKALAELETSISTMMAEEDLINLSVAGNIGEKIELLSKYYKVNEKDRFRNLFDSTYTYRKMDGKTGYFENSETIKTKSGLMVNFCDITGEATKENAEEKGCSLYKVEGGNLKVLIDVNSESKPNTMGRDVFAFILGYDGRLYPYGCKDVSVFLSGNDDKTWRDSGSKYPCLDEEKSTGEGCTARLIEEGFEINY